MYKVLLVDDEKIILEGMSKLIKWKESNMTLIGMAKNGLEAFEMIEKDPPDMIISDIRMPGMDGLQLVQKTKESYPHIRFILLSGYDEFDYARNAMQFGVKHYLLKPCNEQQIMEALLEIIEEIQQDETRESFVQSIKYGLSKVLPYAKEQFLKEFVTNKTYGKRDWEYYRKLFDLQQSSKRIRLILFQVEGSLEFEHLFAVRNISEDIFKAPLLKLSTTIGENVLLLVEDGEEELLFRRIEEIKETFFLYYKMDTTIALSDAGEMIDARKLYRETLECLKHRFYLGEGSLITRGDIALPETAGDQELLFDEEKLSVSLRAGDWSSVQTELAKFYEKLLDIKPEQTVIKSFCIQLFVMMIRQTEAEKMKEYMSQLVYFEQLNTIQQLYEKLLEIAESIAAVNFEKVNNRHSSIVGKVLDAIEQNIENTELSLNWISNEILYMNSDYLGKLFKKEVGDKFSNYVVKNRIEKAKELIKQSDDSKVFEIADQLGFGNNPQYFSQVFKKYTGCSPSEYKKNTINQILNKSVF